MVKVVYYSNTPSSHEAILGGPLSSIEKKKTPSLRVLLFVSMEHSTGCPLVPGLLLFAII